MFLLTPAARPLNVNVVVPLNVLVKKSAKLKSIAEAAIADTTPWVFL